MNSNAIKFCKLKSGTVSFQWRNERDRDNDKLIQYQEEEEKSIRNPMKSSKSI